MANFTHTDLQLVGRHVPDANSGPFDNPQQAQAAGYDSLNPVTGTYQIGVVIEGAFVPLISEKASLIFDRIELAQQQQSQQQASASQQPAAGEQQQPAGEQSAMQTGEQSQQPAGGQPASGEQQPQV